MESKFNVDHLSVERLLSDWLWLCNKHVSLIARNVFGDLFLSDEGTRVWKLDVGSGQLIEIAESVEQFRVLAETREKKQEWFASDAQSAFAAKGLEASDDECIAFKIPVVFRESANTPNNAYVCDLYECVSFLGSLHRQLADVSDGSTVRLRIGREPNTN